MNKIVGSTLIAAGTAIGASMLAFPLVTAGPGFIPSALIFFVVWGTMYLSALLTLEVNLAFKAPQNSYPSMAQATLGTPGRFFTYISYVLLLYMLIAAYITGSGSLLEAAFLMIFDQRLPAWVSQLGCTCVLGAIICLGTRAVDLLNRSLFSIKLILLVLIFAFFIPYIDVSQLTQQIAPRYGWAAMPVVVTAFGFHIVIPSLAPYLHNDVKSLKQVLWYASLLPLIIYLLWIATMLGTLPYEGEFGFHSLATGDGSLTALMLAINAWRPSPWLNAVMNMFANLAMITSFLGVSLGLFDCFQDKKDKQPHRIRSAFLTFTPPLLIVLFYPEGFVALLSVASIFVAIVLMILPALMAFQARRLKLVSPYHVPGGNITLLFVLCMGSAFVVLELMRQAHLLPLWS